MMLARKLQKAAAQASSGILDDDNPAFVAKYTMDDITGSTLNDATPNGNNGTITGATAVSGYIGNAIDLGTESTSKYVDISSTIGSTINAIGFWQYTTGAYRATPYAEGSTSIANNYFGIGFGTGGEMFVFGASPALSYTQVGFGTISLSTWTHILLQNNAGTLEGYVDGVLRTKNQDFGSNINLWRTDVTNNLITELGRIPRNPSNLNRGGIVDQMVISNRSLTQAEITELAAET